ncbi:hypothetical protein [Desulfobacula sp.]|uniref:hypothetical protein n=1 Tax=Desulfobacula sp. TaxID=2593537 RepID=UPI0025C37AD0|nr:hypothetical protein [Desulfobacula sp.]MBC2705264.1 hypothetical protein [Desulfobacula sp.]
MSVNVIAMIAAAFAAFAAMISAYMAYQSWCFNKELSKPAISLIEVKVEGSRVVKDELEIKFLFIFKNVGKEPLKITELSWGFFDFKKNKFDKLGKSRAIINIIHSEAIFNHPVNVKLAGMDPTIIDKDIGKYLEINYEKLFGRFAIIFKLKYKGTLNFSSKEAKDLFFVGYKGRGSIYQIADREYKKMESKLSEDFKVENNQ